MLVSLLAALLAPPPQDFVPPRAAGPGLFCGQTFVLEVGEGESIWQEWPGNIVGRDIYGTYHLETPEGEVVVSENGARSIPEGSVHAVPLGPALGFSVYDKDSSTYSLSRPEGGNIEAVIVRFAESFSPDEASVVLRRFRNDKPAGAQCLQPDNR